MVRNFHVVQNFPIQAFYQAIGNQPCTQTMWSGYKGGFLALKVSQNEVERFQPMNGM